MLVESVVTNVPSEFDDGMGILSHFKRKKDIYNNKKTTNQMHCGIESVYMFKASLPSFRADDVWVSRVMMLFRKGSRNTSTQ